MDSIQRRRYYVLFLLFLVSALHYLDRNVIAVLIVPISADLHLSDTQIGLLTGLAFGIVYALCAIPIARIADRSSRTRVLTIALAVWSTMTLVCGFATNAVTLFLARMGVGVGEAGGQPTMQAIASEVFPPEQRARALSITAFGGNVGVFLGLLVGGVVAQAFGWRMAFRVAGVVGLLLAAVLFFTLKPPAQQEEGVTQMALTTRKLGTWGALKILLGRPAYVFLLIAGSFSTTGLYSVQVWTPTFLVRIHHLSVAQSGLTFAVFNTTAAACGTLIGGILGDRLYKANRRGHLWVLVIAHGFSVPFLVATYLAPSLAVALGAATVSGLILYLYAGPLFATIQALAGAELRATGSAVFMMVISLTGSVLGPLLVGLISDHLRPLFGDQALRYAICIMLSTFPIATGFYYLTMRSASRLLDPTLSDLAPAAT